MYWRTEVPFDSLVGEVLTEIRGMTAFSEEIYFITESGKSFKMYHYQDCCEYVALNDITGNVSDLIGMPILRASVETNTTDTFGVFNTRDPDSFTWTFYTLATIKGYVTLRWLGESNGYYSESVSFSDVTNGE